MNHNTQQQMTRQLAGITLALVAFLQTAAAQYPGWQHAGSLFLLTTPDGGYQNFKNVLAGGGKCGPRSSWSVMVCHAFGIPAIGVGQPGHACVAYKAVNPMTEPQPGSAWKVGFGAGWDKSTLSATKGETLKGPDFLVGIEKRADAQKFSQVEHLRWFANALTTAEKASAVIGIAQKITIPSLLKRPT